MTQFPLMIPLGAVTPALREQGKNFSGEEVLQKGPGALPARLEGAALVPDSFRRDLKEQTWSARWTSTRCRLTLELSWGSNSGWHFSASWGDCCFCDAAGGLGKTFGEFLENDVRVHSAQIFDKLPLSLLVVAPREALECDTDWRHGVRAQLLLPVHAQQLAIANAWWSSSAKPHRGSCCYEHDTAASLVMGAIGISQPSSNGLEQWIRRQFEDNGVPVGCIPEKHCYFVQTYFLRLEASVFELEAIVRDFAVFVRRDPCHRPLVLYTDFAPRVEYVDITYGIAPNLRYSFVEEQWKDSMRSLPENDPETKKKAFDLIAQAKKASEEAQAENRLVQTAEGADAASKTAPPKMW